MSEKKPEKDRQQSNILRYIIGFGAVALAFYCDKMKENDRISNWRSPIAVYSSHVRAMRGWFDHACTACLSGISGSYCQKEQ